MTCLAFSVQQRAELIINSYYCNCCDYGCALLSAKPLEFTSVIPAMLCAVINSVACQVPVLVSSTCYFILCIWCIQMMLLGLSMHPCTSVAECNKIMKRGWDNRSTGATLMNADSSRSHSIFTIYLERCSWLMFYIAFCVIDISISIITCTCVILLS